MGLLAYCSTTCLWGSRSQPEPVTCGDRQPGMIADVSLRLLYLIVSRLLSWLTLLGRASSSGARIWTGHGVLGHNLVKIARCSMITGRTTTSTRAGARAIRQNVSSLCGWGDRRGLRVLGVAAEHPLHIPWACPCTGLCRCDVLGLRGTPARWTGIFCRRCSRTGRSVARRATGRWPGTDGRPSGVSDEARLF